MSIWYLNWPSECTWSKKMQKNKIGPTLAQIRPKFGPKSILTRTKANEYLFWTPLDDEFDNYNPITYNQLIANQMGHEFGQNRPNWPKIRYKLIQATYISKWPLRQADHDGLLGGPQSDQLGQKLAQKCPKNGPILPFLISFFLGDT